MEAMMFACRARIKSVADAIRCRLGWHEQQNDIHQRYVDMIAFGIHPTPSWRCGRCGIHRLWLPGLGFGLPNYHDGDNLLAGLEAERAERRAA